MPCGSSNDTKPNCGARFKERSLDEGQGHCLYVRNKYSFHYSKVLLFLHHQFGPFGYQKASTSGDEIPCNPNSAIYIGIKDTAGALENKILFIRTFSSDTIKFFDPSSLPASSSLIDFRMSWALLAVAEPFTNSTHIY